MRHLRRGDVTLSMGSLSIFIRWSRDIGRQRVLPFFQFQGPRRVQLKHLRLCRGRIQSVPRTPFYLTGSPVPCF
jgi:hypothetical protein